MGSFWVIYALYVTAMLAPTIVREAGRYRQARSRRRRIRSWCVAADSAGLQEVVGETAAWSPSIFTGRVDAHGVRLEDLGWVEGTRHYYRQRLRLTIEGESGITLGAEDVGALDAETRRVLSPLIEGKIAARRAPGSSVGASVVIRPGSIVATFEEKEANQLLQQHFKSVLQTLCEAADRLQPPAGLVSRIAENARADPEWRARLANLRMLLRQYPRHPVTAGALERACHDQRQEVRLEAALALSIGKAEPTLLEIAADELAPDALAGRAVAALGERPPRDRVPAILDHALRTRRHEVAGACLELLGRRGGVEVVEPLAKVLALEKGELAAIAAHALGASRTTSAESPLLRALLSHARNIRVASAQALAEVGSAAAVLPLKEAAERDPGDASLRKATREAIAAIQARLGGATPGQLSLAEGDAGQLSLADEDPHGRVSIADAAGPTSPRRPS
jgi:hypothetical protein